jgi:hypothetical protein
VRLLDAGGVGRDVARRARRHRELLGGQHVVGLLDPGRVRGQAGFGLIGHRPILANMASDPLPRYLWPVDQKFETEAEAAAFRRLAEHLRVRSDVQNIDLMELAGFCRNCLSRWYQEAAAERGAEISKDEAREVVYGMPYEEWKARHQTGAPETAS